MAENLIGPAAITVATTSAAGPFARRRTVSLPTTRVVLTNAGVEAVTITEVALEPLVHAETGAVAEAAMTAAEPGPAAEGPAPLQPGQSTVIAIRGWVPGHPDRYVARLRVRSDPGSAVLAVPLTVKVAAAPVWGVACMLAGLVLVAVLSVMSDAGNLANRLHAVLLYRDETHRLLEELPPPEGQRANQAALDENLGAAIAALHRRRSLGFVDHRAEDADEALTAARAAGNLLIGAQKDKRPGQADLEAALVDWTRLNEQEKAIAQLPKDFVATLPADGLGGSMRRFLGRLADVYLLGPVRSRALGVGQEINRAQLAFLAADSLGTQARAASARRWIQRAAEEMEERGTLWLQTVARARQMIIDYGRISYALESEDLPPAARGTPAGLLRQTASRLDQAELLRDFGAASATLEQALTELTRAEAGLMHESVKAGLKAADAATGIDEVMRVITEVTASPDRSPPAKVKGMTRIMEAWRAKVATVPDEATRRSLTAEVDAAEACLARADLECVVPHNHALRDQWNASVKSRLAEVSAAAVAPMCERWRLDLRRHLDDIEGELRLTTPRQESDRDRWEETLGRLRYEQLQITTATCLDGVTTVGARLTALDHEIFKATLEETPLAPDARVSIAKQWGAADVIEMSEKLVESRPVTLAVATSRDELYVDRPITLAMGGLYKAWRRGIKICVDFGDRTAPAVLDAQQVAKSPTVEHVFGRPGDFKVLVGVAEAFGDRCSPVTRGDLLGTGSLDLQIKASPVSRAREVADDLLNLHSLLSFLVAAVVYYWQFHSKDRIFGQRSFDYVQAFALGFLVQAAASELPKKLAGLVNGSG